MFPTEMAAGFVVHGKVIGHCIASSSRYARLGAGKMAVAKLENWTKLEFQQMTGCDCGPIEEGKVVADNMDTHPITK